MSHSGRASADENLALAIASGQTVRAAAAMAGVSEPTAHRRLATAAFRDRVKQIRADIIGLAVSKLGASMSEAADKLRTLLSSGVETVQLAAAKSILEIGGKLWASVDQQHEIERLDGAVKEIGRINQFGKVESSE